MPNIRGLLCLPLALLLLLAVVPPGLASEGGEHGGGEGGGKPPSTALTLEPFLVNLADEGGKRYLKVTMVIDLRDEARKKLLEERLPIVRDSLLLMLSSLTVKEVASVEGKLKLRDDVRRLVARTIGAPERQPVVFFTEFFIQ